LMWHTLWYEDGGLYFLVHITNTGDNCHPYFVLLPKYLCLNNVCNLSKQSIVCLCVCLFVCWHLNRWFIWYCVKHCQRQFTSGSPKQDCLFYQAAYLLFEENNIEVLTI